MNRLILLPLFIVSRFVLAGIETDYDSHVGFAKGLTSDVQSRSNYGINANDYCDPTNSACLNELNNPAYKGADDVTISNDATTQYHSNPEALDIQDNVNEGRPDLRSDPAYTHAFVGQENAYEITHGISSQYADCDTGQICAEKIEEQYCHIPTNNPVKCNSTPYVIGTTGSQHWLGLPARGFSSGSGFIWYIHDRYPTAPSLPSTVRQIKLSGVVTNPNGSSIYINGQFTGKIVPNWSDGTWYYSGVINTNVVVTSNPIIVTMDNIWILNGVNPMHTTSYSGARTQYLLIDTKRHDVAWADSCDSMLPECQQTSNRCLEGAETRYWEGVYTYLPCWVYEATYQCQFPDTCGDLSDAVIVEETCSLNVEGVCVEKSIRKEVTTMDCKDAELSCGVNTFCLDGDCYDPEPHQSPSEDLNKNVSGLAALSEAAENLTAPPETFQGKPMKCNDKAFGFADCCKDGGWGTDIGIAQCSSTEKALGQAKEKKVTVYVGSYCAYKILGKCIKKKKSYCVFDSKLARIIQQDGRRQIGMTFGSSESPNCRGLTPEEMQRMNFDNMNFSDFYSDLNSNMAVPNPSEIQNRITTQLEANQ
ncbi:type-F conjugative transfer system mating-pair stabilization protein TraN [Vibrio sonorensis]|uniref:type-F conjugative transfer system mating-pair stabilization protein TraN n=1 Tax=Vibrio sonorensis TaxID=1004316 RepID=UPI0008D9D34B|nr:type-F conjugative transfer system mating-pair stabilization protein TraN [Vibrio sonorensis]